MKTSKVIYKYFKIKTSLDFQAVPKLCRHFQSSASLLNSNAEAEIVAETKDKPVAVTKTPLNPIPTAEQVSNISNVVSIVINGTSVSWCKIKRNGDKSTFLVKYLTQKGFPFKSKMHFLNILNEMKSLANQIPKSQIFLIEEYPTVVPNPHMFSYQLHMSQIRAYFLGSLISRADSPQIMSIKSVAVARTFNTYVGSERVSGQHLVDNMITWKPLPSVIFSGTIKNNYEHADPATKESMSSAFLLNLAYWKFTKQFTDSY